MANDLSLVSGHRPTLVDSCVLLDVIAGDPAWRDWSEQALARAADEAPLLLNPIVYAEVSVAYATLEEIDGLLPPSDYVREELPYRAAFLAGKAFVRYRRSGGHKRSPLPDLYIGAHAAIMGYRLLTRDAARFRTYFPRLQLIAP